MRYLVPAFIFHRFDLIYPRRNKVGNEVMSGLHLALIGEGMNRLGLRTYLARKKPFKR